MKEKSSTDKLSNSFRFFPLILTNRFSIMNTINVYFVPKADVHIYSNPVASGEINGAFISKFTHSTFNLSGIISSNN